MGYKRSNNKIVERLAQSEKSIILKFKSFFNEHQSILLVYFKIKFSTDVVFYQFSYLLQLRIIVKFSENFFFKKE